jgi:hypothetical protein
MIGEDLLGYWHLMEQLLFYQEYLEEAKGI